MIRYVEDMEVESRRVLLRLDLDCPVHDGKVADNSRIREALPTLRHVLNRRAKVVLMGGLGCPRGERVPELSLEPVGVELATLLNMDVVLADDCVGDGARKVVSDLYGGRIAMLENLGFHAGEQENDERFCRELAEMADVYVNDAFPVLHRPHASVVGVPGHVREKGAGLLVKSELEALGRLLDDPKRPYVTVFGGRGTASKVRIIRALLDRVDRILVGGALATAFLAATDRRVGASEVDPDCVLHARALLSDATRRSVPIELPVDLVTATGPQSSERRVVGAGSVPQGARIMDIGPETALSFERLISSASTLFWTGPMGMWEEEPFDRGTARVAAAVGGSLGYRVVAGADCIAAVRQHSPRARLDHVLKGGEASLIYLEGRELAGLRALES